jgi:imidazolonepropionase-like amidohydrolase
MRLKFVSTLVLAIILLSATAQQPVDNRNRTIIFDGVNVITMDGGILLRNQRVVVSNGKIVQVTNKPVKKEGALVIDAKGKYLMPGLAEMHAHVPPIDNIEPMKEVLLLYAFNGVTTIRGMLGHPRHLELRSKIESGEILGPRFYTSGPSVNGNSVQSPQSGAAMVRDQKKAGYDFLKLHPGLTVEKFDAIARTAKEVNIPFAGHVSFAVGVWRAIDAGYASIDHMDGFVESLVPGIENMSEQETGIFGIYIGKQADTSRIPKLMNALHDKNIWVVPTQALAERWFAPGEDPEVLRKAPEMKYINAQTLTQWVNAKKNLMNNPQFNAGDVNRFIRLRRQLINACNRYQVGMLLGSDAPQVFNVPGFSLHHELKYMVDSGLSPYDALKMGTTNVGKYFKRSDIGVIKEGAVSDLVLLSGNPLEDISNSKKIEGVMLRNMWLPKDYIDQELKKLEKR